MILAYQLGVNKTLKGFQYLGSATAVLLKKEAQDIQLAMKKLFYSQNTYKILEKLEPF